jgi:hypothetical protein
MYVVTGDEVVPLEAAASSLHRAANVEHLTTKKIAVLVGSGLEGCTATFSLSRQDTRPLRQNILF